MGYIFDALKNRLLGHETPDDGVAHQPHRAGGDTTDDLQPAAADTVSFQTDQAPTASPQAALPDKEAAPGPFKFEDRTNLIDNDALATDDRLVTLSRPSCTMAEEYRSVRTGMLARWDHRRHLVHTITSATPQEGKTITTLNLGFTFAELRNRRVVIVEADLRLPQFEKMISLPSLPGLTDLLEGRVDLSQAVHRLANDRLHVITAGQRVNNRRAVQLLSSSKMVSLIQTLRNSYDHVIIDTPPVIELADAGILGTISDEVMLIVRMNRTPRPLVEQAIRTLTSYNAVVGGVIATDRPPQRSRRYYNKYGYKHGYGYSYNKSHASQQAA